MASGWFQSSSIDIIDISHASKSFVFDNEFVKYSFLNRPIDISNRDIYPNELENCIKDFELSKSKYEMKVVVVLSYDKESEEHEIFYKGYANYCKEIDQYFTIWIFKNNKCGIDNFVAMIES